METAQGSTAAISGSSVLSMNSHNAELFFDNETPLLLDFWAPWCSPCRQIEPLLDQICKRFADRLVVAKVNVDLQQELARTYAIRSIPTLVLVQERREMLRIAPAECSREHVLATLAAQLK